MLSSLGPSRSATASPLSAFRTVSLLRIGTGVIVLIFHALTEAKAAWQFALHQTPWATVDLLNRAGMPLPGLLAIAAAILTLAVGFSWAVGFLTRLFSALFIPVVIGGFIVGQKLALPASTELGLLYLVITISLLISGSGKVSLDTLFQLGAGPKKRR